MPVTEETGVADASQWGEDTPTNHTKIKTERVYDLCV